MEAQHLAGPVQLGDDIGDRFTDAGYFGEALLLDKHFERNGKGREAVGGAGVGLCPVRIAAPQGRSLRVLPEELCPLLYIGLGPSDCLRARKRTYAELYRLPLRTARSTRLRLDPTFFTAFFTAAADLP